MNTESESWIIFVISHSWKGFFIWIVAIFDKEILHKYNVYGFAKKWNKKEQKGIRFNPESVSLVVIFFLLETQKFSDKLHCVISGCFENMAVMDWNTSNECNCIFAVDACLNCWWPFMLLTPNGASKSDPCSPSQNHFLLERAHSTLDKLVIEEFW